MLCCYAHSILLCFVVINRNDFFLGNGPVHLTGSVYQGEQLLLHVNYKTVKYKMLLLNYSCVNPKTVNTLI